MSQESRDFGNQMYLVSSLSTNISWSCILSIPSRNLSFNFLFYKLGTIAPVSNGGGENFNEIAFAFSKPSMNLLNCLQFTNCFLGLSAHHSSGML